MPPLAAAALAILIGGTFGDTIGGLAGLPVGPAAAMAQVGSRPVKEAAVDFVPAWGDRDGNIRVLPETAISGYAFADPAELAPFVETIPVWATDALLPVLKRTGMNVSVGIAEMDATTGIFYNTAVLLGPQGILGKCLKNGLNGQDV